MLWLFLMLLLGVIPGRRNISYHGPPLAAFSSNGLHSCLPWESIRVCWRQVRHKGDPPTLIVC
jgi:hypothetical protein